MNNIGKKVISVVVAIVILLMLCAGIHFGVTGTTEARINKITHKHDGENYYNGIGGRASVEEELDYMILKYTGNLPDPDRGIVDSDTEMDPNPSEVDEDIGEDLDKLKQVLADELKSVPTGIVFHASDKITEQQVFDILSENAAYANGYDGILLKSFRCRKTVIKDGNAEFQLQINYQRDVEEVKQIKAKVAKETDVVMDKLKLDGMSDYEKVKAINTYLCDTVEYPAQEPYSDVSHTAYGSFVEHSAVCDGYARAADILCEEAGVNCQIVIGEVRNGGGHAWNLVQLDGQWYQWDVCWNDGGSSRSEYFLVTDAFMEKSRTWDKTEFPKSATHSYSYN